MNKSETTLSLVVPVHNAAPWLRACLDSLLTQTRSPDEIIAVDDRSTDGSAALLAEYASRYPALRIIAGDGKGAAAARNLGIDHASGQWIAFVDADDWCEPDMYRRLLDMAISADLDIAVCNGRYHFEGREPDRPIYTDPPLRGPVSGAEWLAHKLENRSFLHMVWMHLYRRAFIDRCTLRFVEGLMHEDVIWSTRALALARRVAYDDAPLYVYRKQVRRPLVAERDRRLLKVIEGARTDAALLSEFADGLTDRRLAGAIRWQLVDGGLSLFHKIRQLSSPAERRRQWALARRSGFIRLLWQNASEARQKRKIAGRYLRSLFAVASGR